MLKLECGSASGDLKEDKLRVRVMELKLKPEIETGNRVLALFFKIQVLQTWDTRTASLVLPKELIFQRDKPGFINVASRNCAPFQCKHDGNEAMPAFAFPRLTNCGRMI